MTTGAPSWDRAEPAAAIEAAAARCSNWGRWGPDDRIGTLNHVSPGSRVAAAGLIRRGAVFSLAQPFGTDGPQTGWRRRTNPVHTMLSSGLDSADSQHFPHGLSGADDVVFMPLQCSTQWDGLGHIFDHGRAWNGRPAATTVTSDGDLVTGIEHARDQLVGRGVLLDVGRVLGDDGELADGHPITVAELERTISAQGPTAHVGHGDLLLVRTGQYTRAKRGGWGQYAGGPAPGLSFGTLDWLHAREIAALATDTWGAEVRPNEFDQSFQPFHQVAIPHIGLTLGEMWDLDALAADCAHDGVYEFFLCAPPIPITGAVGSPVNPIAVK